MSFVRGQNETVGLALLTSANGTTRSGAALALTQVSPGTLMVMAQSNITTSSVVATFTPQVSKDNSTWYNVKSVNNATVVDTAAGTGTEVITRLAVEIPNAGGWMYFRCNALLSGAATAAADKTKVDYRWLRHGII